MIDVVENEIQELTGARINTVFSGKKMTWFRRKEPEFYEKTHKICTIADFIAHEITGEYRTDHTYGSRSLLMNLRTRAWDGRLLDMFEVDAEKLCELISPGTVLGYATEEFAEKTGLQAGIPFVSGGGDQQCAAVGMGVTGPGSVEITTGTGVFMLCYSDRVPENLSFKGEDMRSFSIKAMQTDRPDEGRLNVHVTAASGGTPISGARIAISYTGEPDRQLEEVMTTGSAVKELMVAIAFFM